MTISTDNYEATHGRKPRGVGLWAFDVKLLRDGDIKEINVVAYRTMSLTEAKKWMRKAARMLGGVLYISVAG